MSPTPTILLADPHSSLIKPYSFLPSSYAVTHCLSIPKAIEELSQQKPHLVIISTYYAPSQILTLLDAVKDASRSSLIPILIMVDLDKRISLVPGTRWGGKIGVMCSISSETEVLATLSRLNVARL